jgi:hypothetical protein
MTASEVNRLTTMAFLQSTVFGIIPELLAIAGGLRVPRFPKLQCQQPLVVLSYPLIPENLNYINTCNTFSNENQREKINRF